MRARTAAGLVAWSVAMCAAGVRCLPAGEAPTRRGVGMRADDGLAAAMRFAERQDREAASQWASDIALGHTAAKARNRDLGESMEPHLSRPERAATNEVKHKAKAASQEIQAKAARWGSGERTREERGRVDDTRMPAGSANGLELGEVDDVAAGEDDASKLKQLAHEMQHKAIAAKRVAMRMKVHLGESMSTYSSGGGATNSSFDSGPAKCKDVVAPKNGAMGDCPTTMTSGSTCVMTCNSGYNATTYQVACESGDYTPIRCSKTAAPPSPPPVPPPPPPSSIDGPASSSENVQTPSGDMDLGSAQQGSTKADALKKRAKEMNQKAAAARKVAEDLIPDSPSDDLGSTEQMSVGASDSSTLGLEQRANEAQAKATAARQAADEPFVAKGAALGITGDNYRGSSNAATLQQEAKEAQVKASAAKRAAVGVAQGPDDETDLGSADDVTAAQQPFDKVSSSPRMFKVTAATSLAPEEEKKVPENHATSFVFPNVLDVTQHDTLDYGNAIVGESKNATTKAEVKNTTQAVKNAAANKTLKPDKNATRESKPKPAKKVTSKPTSKPTPRPTSAKVALDVKLRALVAKQAMTIKKLQKKLSTRVKPDHTAAFKKEMQQKTAARLPHTVLRILRTKSVDPNGKIAKVNNLQKLLATTQSPVLRKTIELKIRKLQASTDQSDQVKAMLGPSALRSKVENILSPGVEKAKTAAKKADQKAAEKHADAEHAQQMITELQKRLDATQKAATHKNKLYADARKKFKSETAKLAASAKTELRQADSVIAEDISAKEKAEQAKHAAAEALKRASRKAIRASEKLKIVKAALVRAKESKHKKVEGSKAVMNKYKADALVVKELEQKAEASLRLVANSKRRLRKQEKQADKVGKAEESSVKNSEKQASAAAAADSAKQHAKEADAKSYQKAKMEMYRTASEVATSTATKIETEATSELGEQAEQDLAQARAQARLDAKKAQAVSARLSSMASKASLQQLKQSMKRVAMPPKESFTIAKNADAQEVSNAETKVDDWYKQFQAAKKAKVEGALAAQHQDMQMTMVAGISPLAGDEGGDEEHDLGESGDITDPVHQPSSRPPPSPPPAWGREARRESLALDSLRPS